MLYFLRGLVPVIVQADLTNGDHLLVGRQSAQVIDPLVAPARGRVRMNADGGVDAGEALGQGQHGRGVVQVERGHDDARHAHRGRALHHGRHVVVEGLEVKMTMRVK